MTINKSIKIKLMLSLFCIIIVVAFAGCAAPSNTAESNGDESTKDLFAMDTYMSFTAYGKNSEQATDAAAEKVQELDYMLTSEKYAASEDSESSRVCEVYQLNEKGEGQLSDEVDYLLNRALSTNKLTDGAFNPCMYAIMEAWGFTSQNYRVPSEDELTELLKLTNLSNLDYDMDNQYLKINMQGMKIDFGGIAKGYTSSQIVEIFKAHGIENGLINLGGNVQALGTKPDGSLWRVGIQHPEDVGSTIGIISIADKAVITSGGYERYFEDNGKIYHHIIDPETGVPVDNGIQSMTIVSEDGTLADALSTALFVMGKDKAQQFWRTYGETEGFDIVFVDEDCKLYVSEGIAENFEAADGYEVIYIEK